ncbi:cupin domain-containing protein [Nocardia terpenica]|uniref:Cupin domain-containing protein n=1 Tax=Nocardia terpenica TaxID=455432 RepID=A0A6G9Z2N3_9NOCA|nr:cupin domain-containing protein [Nocardia terpenica]QIS19641.1 cupin domain-containing protein [Nocardia terpenica]
MHASIRAALLAAGAAMSATLVPVAAHADPPPAYGEIKVTPLFSTTVGDKQIRLLDISMPPGRSTGWHYHDGPIYGFVRGGTLHHYNSSCASDGVYGPGGVISEASGKGYVHIGVNEGTEPVLLTALYTLPLGAPLAEPAPSPGCPGLP